MTQAEKNITPNSLNLPLNQVERKDLRRNLTIIRHFQQIYRTSAFAVSMH